MYAYVRGRARARARVSGLGFFYRRFSLSSFFLLVCLSSRAYRQGYIHYVLMNDEEGGGKNLPRRISKLIDEKSKSERARERETNEASIQTVFSVVVVFCCL